MSNEASHQWIKDGAGKVICEWCNLERAPELDVERLAAESGRYFNIPCGPETIPAIDEARLERAVQTVTAEHRIDIIENEENGDMASVVTPPEFARLIAAAYLRSPGVEVAS